MSVAGRCFDSDGNCEFVCVCVSETNIGNLYHLKNCLKILLYVVASTATSAIGLPTMDQLGLGPKTGVDHAFVVSQAIIGN